MNKLAERRMNRKYERKSKYNTAICFNRKDDVQGKNSRGKRNKKTRNGVNQCRLYITIKIVTTNVRGPGEILCAP